MDWKEIERLQADFQRTQLSTTAQRLSERNCIEILMKLQEMQMIDVLHSCDGKEYLTPSHLYREIQDEVYVHGGRINLVDLQQALNIDFSHVEMKCQELVAADKDYQLVYGRLIDNSYLDRIAEEINDNLQACGQIKLSEVSKSYDLPGEFLLHELMKRLGVIIMGKVDQQSKETIYTDVFLNKHKSRIRGVLTAVTRPLPINVLHAADDLPLHLIFVIVEELIQEGRITGQVVGGRSDKSTFLPSIYTQTQKQWIDNFFKQNNYLEYDTVARLGISDAKSYLKQRFGDGNTAPVFLKSVCIGRGIVDHVTAVVEETIASEDWCDVATILPSSFTRDDGNELLRQVMRDRGKPQGVVFGDTMVTSQRFIDACAKHFDKLIKEKAEKEANTKSILVLTEEERKDHLVQMTSSEPNKKADKKEERRRKAVEGQGGAKKMGETGSGVGAREVKTRGKDKKRLKWKKEQEEAGSKPPPKRRQDNDGTFMGVEEVEGVLRGHMPDCPEELVGGIADKLLRPLNDKYQSAVKSVFQKHSPSQGGAPGRKRLEEEVNVLWTNARLFSNSLSLFSDDAAASMAKHLLQTTCSHVANLLFVIAASEFGLSAPLANDVTEEVRIKLLSRFPSNVKLPLTTLNASLHGKSFADFESALSEATASSACDVFLKHPDKKKDRQTMHGHKMSLLQQLQESTDPAMTLHLCSLVIFQTVTGTMCDVTGRHVPVVIDKLQEYVDRDTFVELVDYQEAIMRSARLQEDAEVEEELASKMEKIKELASSTKKKNS